MNLGILATKGSWQQYIHRRFVMDDIRKGQIAFAYLKNNLREKGIRITPDLRREVGNTAKAIDISIEEAMEFTEDIIRELVEEAFAKPKKRS